MPKPRKLKPASAPEAAKPKKAAAARAPKLPKQEIHHFPDGSDGPGGEQWIPTSLLAKMHVFAMHYLETGDSIGSAEKAGFYEKDANVQSKRGTVAGLLKNDAVKRILTEQYNAIVAKTGATVERVWQEYARIAFCDPGEAYDEFGEPLPPSQMPEDVRRAMTGLKVVRKTFGEDGESVEKEMKFSGKQAALDQLARLHRMLDSDKLVLLTGDEFLQQMEEGRKRNAQRVR